MTIPMILTFSRIALAPVFYIIYLAAGGGSTVALLGAWGVFALIEISDLLDGYLARKLGQVSELGKVLDPFADSVSRLTYFIAFAGSGIMPLWIVLILVYRDVGVAYIRVMIAGGKVFLPARVSGKIKAWVYAVAGIVGLGNYSLRKSGLFADSLMVVGDISFWLFMLCGAVALWSLADYAVFFAKNFRRAS